MSTRPVKSWLWLGAGVLVVAALGCLHTPKPKADIRDLQSSAENFHRLIRWGDLKGASRYLVPEQRIDYVKGIIDRGEEDALKVLDYELEDVQYAPESAVLVSKITWNRLPSVTARSEAMLTTWEDREGVWLIAEIVGGPLPLERKPRPGADAGR
jgi:hypothetical protein